MVHRIAGIRRKLLRAREHLKTVDEIGRKIVYSKYALIPEKCEDPDEVAFRLRLPAIPDNYVMAAADCIHNLRCVLDHLVWQIADKHEPNRPVNEKKRNMFPICLSQGEFEEQVRRKRLNGLPRSAIDLVEAVQPYHAGYELMEILGELENIDKHRALIVVGSVTRNIFSETFEAHGLRLPFASQAEHVRDNAVFMKLHRRWIPAAFSSFGEVEVEAHGIMEIAFQDHPAQGLNVQWTLQALTDFVGDQLMPAFKVFLD